MILSSADSERLAADQNQCRPIDPLPVSEKSRNQRCTRRSLSPTRRADPAVVAQSPAGVARPLRIRTGGSVAASQPAAAAAGASKATQARTAHKKPEILQVTSHNNYYRAQILDNSRGSRGLALACFARPEKFLRESDVQAPSDGSAKAIAAPVSVTRRG